jgi:hypothetical protein
VDLFGKGRPSALEHHVAPASRSLSTPYSSPAVAVDVRDAVEHDPVACAGHPHRAGQQWGEFIALSRASSAATLTRS